MKLCFRWWCLHTICFCCSSLILYTFQNTNSKSRHSGWSTFFLPGKLSERQDMLWWSSQQNILTKMCMKTAYLKKVVSNIVPVLASVSSMRSVYHTQYSVLQDLFVKFLSIWCRKCYNIENISEILRRMKENGGDFILRRYSGGISFQILRQLKIMRIIWCWRGIRVFIIMAVLRW